MRLRLSSSESLLLVGLMLALVGAGIAYYFGFSEPTSGTPAYVGGLIGVTAFVCVLTGLIVGWRARFGHRNPAMWRGQTVNPPRRLHPLGAIGTQLRIMRLKWRYWRSRGK